MLCLKLCSDGFLTVSIGPEAGCWYVAQAGMRQKITAISNNFLMLGSYHFFLDKFFCLWFYILDTSVVLCLKVAGSPDGLFCCLKLTQLNQSIMRGNDSVRIKNRLEEVCFRFQIPQKKYTPTKLSEKSQQNQDILRVPLIDLIVYKCKLLGIPVR